MKVTTKVRTEMVLSVEEAKKLKAFFDCVSTSEIRSALDSRSDSEKVYFSAYDILDIVRKVGDTL